MVEAQMAVACLRLVSFSPLSSSLPLDLVRRALP
jgi:hypothetical protein